VRQGLCAEILQELLVTAGRQTSLERFDADHPSTICAPELKQPLAGILLVAAVEGDYTPRQLRRQIGC
jgi:hypothetical protein